MRWTTAFAAILLSIPCRAQSDPSAAGYPFPVPQGMGAPAVPADNPVTAEKVDLGKMLFFDTRLSRNKSVSCATCHRPDAGWTDQHTVSHGINGQTGVRNAPTVLNAAYQQFQFWDGRASSLEDQAKGPIANPVEMGFTLDEAAQRIAGIQGYAGYFKKAFGDPQVTIDRIAQAIASFERTVLTGASPYDRYQAGDATALSPDARQGMTVFFGKAHCMFCHTGANFTDDNFHNLGVGMGGQNPDLGRYGVTKLDSDRGAFKTPTLRNLADTFPYMHDGSMASLADVIEFYDDGGRRNPWQDGLLRPLNLTDDEKRYLLEFLQSLNGVKPIVQAPQLPQ